jgi:hypothetical protein
MMENRRGNILDTVPLTPLVSSGGKLIAEAAAWYNESIPLNEPLISPATKSGRTFYTSLGHSSSSESIQNLGRVSLTGKHGRTRGSSSTSSGDYDGSSNRTLDIDPEANTSWS